MFGELDNKVPAHTRITMLSYSSGLLERSALWLLRHRGHPLNIEESVKYFKSDVAKLTKSLSKSLTKQYVAVINKQIKDLISNNVPKAIASRVVELITLSTAFDIVEIIKASKKSAAFVAAVYFDIGARLELIWIRQKIASFQWKIDGTILPSQGLLMTFIPINLRLSVMWCKALRKAIPRLRFPNG